MIRKLSILLVIIVFAQTQQKEEGRLSIESKNISAYTFNYPEIKVYFFLDIISTYSIKHAFVKYSTNTRTDQVRIRFNYDDYESKVDAYFEKVFEESDGPVTIEEAYLIDSTGKYLQSLDAPYVVQIPKVYVEKKEYFEDQDSFKFTFWVNSKVPGSFYILQTLETIYRGKYNYPLKDTENHVMDLLVEKN